MSETNQKYQLTKREADILSILWDSGKPLVASEIVKSNPSLNINTVQAVLKNLLKKDLIQIAEIVYSGTVLSRSYKPQISKMDFTTNKLVEEFGEMSHVVSIPYLVEKLLDQEKDQAAALEQLEQLICERKEALRSKN